MFRTFYLVFSGVPDVECVRSSVQNNKVDLLHALPKRGWEGRGLLRLFRPFELVQGLFRTSYYKYQLFSGVPDVTGVRSSVLWSCWHLKLPPFARVQGIQQICQTTPPSGEPWSLYRLEILQCPRICQASRSFAYWIMHSTIHL